MPGVEVEAEEAERRGVAAVEAAGHPGGVEEDVLADEDQADRGDAEVDPAQPARQGARQRADRPGQQDGEDQGQQGRQAEAGGRLDAEPLVPGEVAVAVRADGQEERVGQRQLAGDAGQDGQPDRADDRRHGEQAGLLPELAQLVGRQQQQGPHHHEGDLGAVAAGGVRHASAPACRTGRPAGPAARRPSRCRARRR